MDHNQQEIKEEIASTFSRESGSQRTDDLNSSYQDFNGSSDKSPSVTSPSKTPSFDQDSKRYTTLTNPNETTFQKQQLRDNITLMPVKVKDVMNIFKNNSDYKDKSPVMINMKEHDIDKVIQQQGYGYSPKPSVSPVKFPQQPNVVYRMEQGSPMFVGKSISKENGKDKPAKKKEFTRRNRRSFEEIEETPLSEDTSLYYTEPVRSGRNSGNFYSATSRDQQVYIMPETEVTAFPMIGTQGYQKRERPRKNHSKPGFFQSLTRRNPRSRSRSRFGMYRSRPYRSRSRSYMRRRPRSRQLRKKVRIRSRSRAPPRRIIRRGQPSCGKICPQMVPTLNTCCGMAPTACTRFPLCDNECTSLRSRGMSPLMVPQPARRYTKNRGDHTKNRGDLIGFYGREMKRGSRPTGSRPSRPIITPPYRPRMAASRPRMVSSRPVMTGRSAANIACHCNLCQEKLQFIQPGVCTKKQNMWVNEYAVIPKPEVTLIDPCRDLDPRIYPRADRPCLRDSHGNPLTDCIGRPLRDPIGKRFLRFTANGSVLDTSFRGNFYTGQPPLCVKCPLPKNTCAPDTTHNWWMSCGYPIRPNMGPFYNNVIAAEHRQKICKIP